MIMLPMMMGLMIGCPVDYSIYHQNPWSNVLNVLYCDFGVLVGLFMLILTLQVCDFPEILMSELTWWRHWPKCFQVNHSKIIKVRTQVHVMLSYTHNVAAKGATLLLLYLKQLLTSLEPSLSPTSALSCDVDQPRTKFNSCRSCDATTLFQSKVKDVIAFYGNIIGNVRYTMNVIF